MCGNWCSLLYRHRLYHGHVRVYRLQGHPCDASTAPTIGGIGDCTSSRASGSTCQPTCNLEYSVSGTSSCTLGTLTAATCNSTFPAESDAGRSVNTSRHHCCQIELHRHRRRHHLLLHPNSSSTTTMPRDSRASSWLWWRRLSTCCK